jgi:hypothetical protein
MIAMPKIISTAPRPIPKSNATWAEARWPVKHDLSPVGIDLLLHVSHGERPLLKYSVSLLWNDMPVRRICVGYRHNGFEATVAHIHCYDDRIIMDGASELVPFPCDDVAGGVLQACAHYGIAFSGTLVVPSPIIQTGFYSE